MLGFMEIDQKIKQNGTICLKVILVVLCIYIRSRLMKGKILSLALIVCVVCLFNLSLFADSSKYQTELAYNESRSTNENENLGFDDFNEDLYIDEFDYQYAIIEDNAENFNRSMFNFNDKLYYHVIKPANKGYNKVIPEKARMSIRKMFLNIGMPGRFLNCLFQGKFKGAGSEVARFFINSTLGVAGMFDPAKKLLKLEMQDEDFGQTLAKFGVNNGTYLVLPGLGPSSTRDTIGLIGDIAMNPLTWVSAFVTPFASAGRPYDTFNNFSLDDGRLYEGIVEGAIDPYVALQDTYVQNRNEKIEK